MLRSLIHCPIEIHWSLFAWNVSSFCKWRTRIKRPFDCVINSAQIDLTICTRSMCVRIVEIIIFEFNQRQLLIAHPIENAILPLEHVALHNAQFHLIRNQKYRVRSVVACSSVPGRRWVSSIAVLMLLSASLRCKGDHKTNDETENDKDVFFVFVLWYAIMIP